MVDSTFSGEELKAAKKSGKMQGQNGCQRRHFSQQKGPQGQAQVKNRGNGQYCVKVIPPEILG